MIAMIKNSFRIIILFFSLANLFPIQAFIGVKSYLLWVILSIHCKKTHHSISLVLYGYVLQHKTQKKHCSRLFFTVTTVLNIFTFAEL